MRTLRHAAGPEMSRFGSGAAWWIPLLATLSGACAQIDSGDGSGREAVSRAADSQVVYVLSENPSCRTCTIQLTRLQQIRDSEPPWLGDRVFISRDSRGRLHAISSQVTPGTIQVLDSTGSRWRSYGRGRGSGPGEGERLVSPFFGPADTAYVTIRSLQESRSGPPISNSRERFTYREDSRVSWCHVPENSWLPRGFRRVAMRDGRSMS